jgi:hypothetical protein
VTIPTPACALGRGGAGLHQLGHLGGQHRPLHDRGHVLGARPAQTRQVAPGLVPRGAVEDRALAQAERPEQARQLGHLPVNLLRDAVEPDQQAGAAAVAQRPQRLAVGQLDGGREQIGAEQGAGGGARILHASEARDHEPVHVRPRAELERRLDQHAERAAGADVELGQIVARHVLHDLAAAPHEAAVGRDHGEADDQVARGAVEMPPRARGVAGEDPAERGPIRRARVEREPLTTGAERGLQRVQGEPGLDGHGEVAGLVLQDPVQAPEPEDQADSVGWRADRHLGAAAPGRDGQRRLARDLQQQRDLLLRAGKGHRLGGAALDDVRRAVDAREHMRRADDGAQLVGQERRHGEPPESRARSAERGPSLRSGADGRPGRPRRRPCCSGRSCRGCRGPSG